MLSRRHLRIKVLHALYGHWQNPGKEIGPASRKLEESIRSIYNLFLFELKAIASLRLIAEERMEKKRGRQRPTAEDLNPSPNFLENSVLKWLDENESFQKRAEQNHIQFGDDRELLKTLFKKLEETAEFLSYQELSNPTFKEDRDFIKWVYENFLVQNESLHHFYDEKNLHWADDLDAAQMMVSKTLKALKSDQENKLPKLLKNQDDLDFAMTLFQKSIANNQRYEELIRAKAQNWETERLALLDTILMKMALAEMTQFSSIPIKVSLNEYIELSKQYSTPKSANFINGVLDKAKAELQESGEIRKIGRGLL